MARRRSRLPLLQVEAAVDNSVSHIPSALLKLSSHKMLRLLDLRYQTSERPVPLGPNITGLDAGRCGTVRLISCPYVRYRGRV